MKRLLLLSFAAFVFCVTASAQITLTDSMYRVYDGQGNPVTLDAIVKAMGGADAIFLGEQHDDAVGHAIETELFRRAVQTYSPQRKVALSMEMFERDVQVVVNEYVSGLISEQHFLSSSRPWANYKTDYRPLVELAKEKHLDVIAANAPRRYVNMVSRGGRDVLNGLSKEAKSWLAPLPYPEPSSAYRDKFAALMSGNTGDPAAMNPSAQANLIYSQSLWDATMANSVAMYLKKNKGTLVVHLNGGFHTENRLGTIDQLLNYRRKTRAIVVTMRPEDDFKTFDKTKHTALGDFVILTAPKAKTTGVLLEIFKRMKEQSQSLKTLSADVMMTRYNSQLKESDTYQGTVSYLPKTANHLMYVRLDWVKPVTEQLLIIGDQYSLYRPQLNQRILGSLKNMGTNASSRSPLQFMSMSVEQLRAENTITYFGQEKISGQIDSWHLEVTPNSVTSYRSADIWIDSEGMPRQLKINELNSDTTTVLLSDIQKNVTINAEIFDPKYPTTVKTLRN